MAAPKEDPERYTYGLYHQVFIEKEVIHGELTRNDISTYGSPGLRRSNIVPTEHINVIKQICSNCLSYTRIRCS